ncbi:MAG: L-threonylcarbamoyladenylate synthase, partial [Rickettsiales bacterium]|nr:L-threonylcarbamoyladenylate synthase [Rickettsiales bacterium]
AFWPGALTLVLPLKPDATISEKLTAGGNTLAIRCPKHPVAQKLLQVFDGGLAAPSANRSGKISPTLSHHVKAEFPDEELLIIEGGACEVGIESTVVLCDEQSVRILRSGSITASQIEALGIELDISMQQQTDQPLQSPGLLTSHYAPSLPLRINAMEVESHEALIAFGPQPLSGAARTLNLSSRGDLDEAAVHLFATMRALDDSKFSGIAVMPIPNQGIGVAINDRLRRAAADREA